MPGYLKRLIILTISLAFAAAAVAAVPKGAADMILNGGKNGNVPFPHQRHQLALENDCQTCHFLYDQQPGIIDVMKADGRLKKKQVMNKQCTKCHKQRLRSKMKAGPVKCKTCHIKDNS